ncbi:lysophospholipid acyltransferase family protein [Aerococcus urinae]|nr:lysophospholipid acyltransferase family protein [Aerococcus urinae]
MLENPSEVTIMWFYNFMAYLVKGLIRIVNGKPELSYHEDYDPDQQYLIVAPHRSVLDPVIIGIHTLPKPVHFLAKQELFSSSLVNWCLDHLGVMPVDRENPSMVSLKSAVTELKKGEDNVGLFPTGSRYSTEIKDGAAVLAKMGKVNILPVAYQGPIHISGLFSRKAKNRVKFRVGKPIYLPAGKKLSKEELKEIDQQIGQAFQEIDREIDPNYHYDLEKAIRERDRK